MKMLKPMLAAAGLMAALSLGAPALAQESSYKLGNVWTASRIHVLPGEQEKYMDYLAGQWKRVQEYAKKEGKVLNYHVLANNSAGKDQPNIILLIESKDYMTVAEREAWRVKLNKFLETDNRKADAEGAARGAMREGMGSTQYQELILK